MRKRILLIELDVDDTLYNDIIKTDSDCIIEETVMSEEEIDEYGTPIMYWG